MKNDPPSAASVSHSVALQTAHELDAAGRFADSMDVLKQASAQRDLPAMSELAHRLLVGDRTPKSPPHALRLLIESGNGGEPRALARLAALSAAGAYVKQDWPQALKLLGQAAAGGDAAARGQLLALQGAEMPPSGGASHDWHQLAARVPLGYWHSPAHEVPLHDSVRRIDGLVPLPVCRWLIGRATGRLQPALVYDAVSREHQRHEMRTNSMALFDYANFDVVQFLLQSRMSRTCGYPMQHFETPMVLHYAVGQQITPHFDFIDANAADYAEQIQVLGQRMITFLLYLNDDFEGGETTFPELGIAHRGRAGDGLFFINARADLSPDRRMLHTGSPPTRGEKWIVSQFIVSKALRP